MIRIEKDKLIIEIPCKGREPLSALAEFQKSLIDLLHIANLKTGQHPERTIINGVHFTTNLLHEMMISEDQNAVINKVLITDGMDEFNKWGK